MTTIIAGPSPTAGDQRDAERYRHAAEDALQQLDWCIGYLEAIHKTDVSESLAENRSRIRGLLGDATS